MELLATQQPGSLETRVSRLEQAQLTLATFLPLLLQIRDDIVEMKSDIFQLKVDVAVLKTDVAELKNDVSELKIDVATLKIDVAELKNDVSLLKLDLADLKPRVSNLETASGTLLDKVDFLLSESAGHTTQMRALEQLMERQEERFDRHFEYTHLSFERLGV